MVSIKKYNNCIQLTVKSVTFFAKQKNVPLFTSADAGVRIFLQNLELLPRSNNFELNKYKLVYQHSLFTNLGEVMRKIVMFCSVFFCTSVIAVDADFSKSFVVPEKSTINKVTLGGIDAVGNSYSVDFSLQENLSLTITDAVIQNSLSEEFEQNLRNTVWKGIYDVNNDHFTTTLNLVVVQNGYVGGEVIHSESIEEGDGYLNARVTGDIITQFEINGTFIDEDRIDLETLGTLTESTPSRQLIRIKRMRALEFRNDGDGSNWNTNREYRLVLENGILSGTVGVPSDTIGTNDGTSENGAISLTQQ